MIRKTVCRGLPVALILAVATAAQGATITVSATAPTVDAADIAMLNVTGQYDTGGNEGHIWSNRPLQGQTFTTLGNSEGYSLSAVTLRNFNNTINNNSATWTVRVGAVSGTTFSPVAAGNSNNTISYVPGDYLTFTFDSPVSLAPDTVYGFDWDTTGSGFVTCNNTDVNYAGGTNFRHGGGGNGNENNLLFPGDDRVFHLDLTANSTPPVGLPIAGITGHEDGDSFMGNGSMPTAVNGAGVTKPDPTDPSTWTHTNTWQTDWQGAFPGGSSSGANQGWAVIDLGSPQATLDEMLLWNVNEGNALDRGTQTFDIYYAVSPTVTPPVRTGSFQAYDFSSGGWTQLGGTQTLAQGTASGALPVSGTFDISGASGARYIGIDMLSNYGSTFRVGLAEIVVTATVPVVIPEPMTMLAVGLGVAGLGRYISKRRRA